MYFSVIWHVVMDYGGPRYNIASWAWLVVARVCVMLSEINYRDQEMIAL